MTSLLILIASLNFLMGKSTCRLSTKLVTRSNTNVSLTCKIIDSDNKTFFDNQVIWFKRRKGLGHHKSEIVREGNLTFNPITKADTGRYVCANFNHSLYKSISIIVHPFNYSKKKRPKRAAVKSDIPSPNTLMYAESTMGTVLNQLPTKQELYHQSHETGSTLHQNDIQTDKPERVGSKLQLSCEIERASYDSYKVVWGRRTNKLRFENVADLVKLAKNGSKQLLELDQLDSPYTLNRAIKTFNPLTMSDRGTYFCMNLKNELFQIVRIKVKNELKCQLEQFKCGNGEKCIEQYELCDKIHQCTDGSDEEWKLCKKKQCIGSIRCGDRCIPTSSCCDIRIDSSCPFIVRNKCCPPISIKKDDINSIDVMDTNKHVLPPKPLTLADKVILTIATACVVLTVSLIIYYVMKERNTRNSHNSNNRNGTPVPPIIRTDDDDNSSMRFATEIGIGNSNSLEYLDLPPTYADSTRNTPINSPESSCRSSLQDILTTIDYHATLPPTYNEALANLKSSNLSLSDQLESSKSIFLDVPNITPGTSRDDNE